MRMNQIGVVVDVRVGNCGVWASVRCRRCMMVGGTERFECIGQCAGRDPGCGPRVPVVVFQQSGYRKRLGIFGALCGFENIFPISKLDHFE